MIINDKIYFEADTLVEGNTTKIVYKGSLCENCSEDICAPELVSKRIRDSKSQYVNEHNWNNSVDGCIEERVSEALVIEGFYVVIKANPSPFTCCLKLGEWEEGALNKRPDKADNKWCYHGQQK